MNENLLTQEEQLDDFDPTKDYLTELVGEGKKFKDHASLAKGKAESDSYIKILERRLDEMKTDYLDLRKQSETKAKLEDLITKLETTRSSSENTTNANEDKLAIDPKQIESLVENKYKEIEMSRQQTSNFETVRDKLQEWYGPNYKATVGQKIKDLGITEEELNVLAKRQPKMILKSLEPPQHRQEQFEAPPRNSQRRDNFAPTGQKERTWSYYQQLKKENPKVWFDRKTAVQMQEDAIRLGDKFYDGDFYVKGLHE